jgi:hypothetical protein
MSSTFADFPCFCPILILFKRNPDWEGGTDAWHLPPLTLIEAYQTSCQTRSVIGTERQAFDRPLHGNHPSRALFVTVGSPYDVHKIYAHVGLVLSVCPSREPLYGI